VRLYVAAALLYGQAMALLALRSPWAAVAASGLGLCALLAKVALEVGEIAAAVEEAKDAVERAESAERRLEAIESKVEALSRAAALSRIA
jgi:hypothetical protein